MGMVFIKVICTQKWTKVESFDGSWRPKCHVEPKALIMVEWVQILTWEEKLYPCLGESYFILITQEVGKHELTSLYKEIIARGTSYGKYELTSIYKELGPRGTSYPISEYSKVVKVFLSRRLVQKKVDSYIGYMLHFALQLQEISQYLVYFLALVF